MPHAKPQILKSVGGVSLFVAAIAIYHRECPAALPQRPNVLLIVCDDLNSHVSTSGYSPISTPNLQRLAATGVTFSRAYCQFPICNPSRSSFLTGIYPETTGVLKNPTDLRRTRPGTITLPEFFKRNGYWTGGVGKVFHNGCDPGSQVWGEYRSFENERNPVILELRREFENRHGSAQLPQNREAWQRVIQENRPFIAGAVPPGYGPTDMSDAEHKDGKAVRQVASWLNARRYGDRPFFIACGINKPHIPFWAPRSYFDAYPTQSLRPVPVPEGDLEDVPQQAVNKKRPREFGFTPGTENTELRLKYMQAYHACVSFADAQIGLLLDALESNGLRDNTIVVFFSDHGYHLGEHYLWGKMTLFEECARVPLIVRVPGITPEGSVCSGLVELVDVYPTLAELCRLPLPPGVQGRSFTAQLSDPAHSGRESAYTMLRRGRTLGRSIRTARWRYAEWLPSGKAELYDLAHDPQELTNLANDPQSAKIVADMHARLLRRTEAAQNRPSHNASSSGAGIASVVALIAAGLLLFYARSRKSPPANPVSSQDVRIAA